jgi:hypothetical protein
MSASKVGRVILNAPILVAWLAFALLVLAPAALHAGPPVNVPLTPGSGLTLRLSTPLTQLPHFGFIPVQASVENLSARDGEWDVQFMVGNGGAAAPLTLASRHPLAVPAGQSREVWLYVPVARAGFATNTTGPGGAGGPVAVISKTPTGTKVTRTMASASGRVLMTMVTEINETTGELTMQNISNTGTVVSTNTQRPPAGMSVTYTIDPVRGFVSPRYRSNVGPFTVTVVTGSTGAPVPVTPVPPRVTITPLPNGTKVTRVLTGFRPTTEEFLFEPAAGTVRTTRTMPDGSSATSMRSIPATPGTETTYTINPTDGTYGTQTRLVPNSTAPAKMLVVVGPAAPAGPATSGASASSGPSAPPVGTPTGVPVLTTVVVEISGSGIAGLARVALPSAPATNPMRPFAVSASLDSSLRAVLASQVTGAPNLATVNAAQLPADWRLWSSFAGVILTVDEYAALDAARRAALRGWVGLGGQLFLVPAPGERAEERREAVGAGRIVTLAVPAPDAVGTTTRTSLALYSPAALRNTFNLYSETVGLPDRESLFVKDTPLGDEIKFDGNDASWVAVFLVIFAAVIGPVNLFLFAPVGRRHRLFWTTPALALLGGLLLVGVIFFQDGTGGAGRRSTLVVLLPGQNQAAVFQEQAARTGFLPRRSFALDDDTLLAPLALGPEGLRFGGAQQVASREAGEAGGDWFRSRAGLAHGLRRLAPTRGRVEIAGTAPDGTPVVESSLATVLREFVLQDAAGKLWFTRELAPGRRISLEAPPRGAALDSAALNGSPALLRAYGAAAAPGPGRWSAYGGATDLAPLTTLTSIRWGDSTIVYTGVAESTAKSAVKGGAL